MRIYTFNNWVQKGGERGRSDEAPSSTTDSVAIFYDVEVEKSVFMKLILINI